MHTPVFPFLLVRTAGLSPFPLSIQWPDDAAQRAAEAESAQEVQQAFDTVLQGLPDSLLRTAVYNARKRFFQKQQAPQQGFEKMLLEHPHQPILAQLLDSLQDWKKSQSQKILAEDKVEAGLVGNWRIIQQAAEQPDFRKALLFASHDLLDRLPAFCVKAPEHFTAKDRQTGLTVLQYLTRGAYKTSPLSRFTTVSLWRWQQSFIPVDADEPAFLQAAKAVVTPNVALLPALYEVLLGEPVFYQSLLLGLNPCIVTRSGENGRQWLYFDGENESFQQLNPNPAVEAVIRICLDHQRQISWRALLKELQTTIDADESRLQGLIHELVALGLLAWQLPERGLTPGWCGNLYNYLGYLQLAPVILEAAALLQWLRTAARTLPFQSVAEAQTTQRQTVQQVKAFFERYNGPSPPIPAEQIFFEDVEKSQPIELPPEIIQDLADQLADCWRSSGPQYLSTFRAALYAFTVAEMAFGEARPFLDFCKTFLSQKADWEKQPPVAVPPFQGKMGALIQVIKKENGSYGAVVNGLFPGGGKLMARWLHLFPVEARESLQAWFPNDAMAFPWQGWSNANFQPALSAATLSVPDGRVGGRTGSPNFLMGNLDVQRTTDGPVLVDRPSGRRVWFSDLGLESPETRPPAMQVLWYLGMPPVSLESLWPADSGWQETGPGWYYRPRITFQSLVLRRASWRMEPAAWRSWLLASGATGERLLHLRSALLQGDLPQQFFVRFAGNKPQYVDRDSPVGLLLLEKILRGATKDLWCIEMLPNGTERAMEWVMELEIPEGCL